MLVRLTGNSLTAFTIQPPHPIDPFYLVVFLTMPPIYHKRQADVGDQVVRPFVLNQKLENSSLISQGGALNDNRIDSVSCNTVGFSRHFGVGHVRTQAHNKRGASSLTK